MSSGRRWTQHDEDSARLPENMTRVGYDADTGRYTFMDTRQGTLYTSEPGSVYGVLRPTGGGKARGGSGGGSLSSRPEAFEGGIPRSPPRTNTEGQHAPQTFQEFLPPSLIASPSPKRRSGSKIFNGVSNLTRRSTVSHGATTTNGKGTAGQSMPGGDAEKGMKTSQRKGHSRHRSEDISHLGSSASRHDDDDDSTSNAPPKLKKSVRASMNLGSAISSLRRSVSSAVSARRKSQHQRKSTLGRASRFGQEEGGDARKGGAVGGYEELVDGEDEKGLLAEEGRGATEHGKSGSSAF